MPGKTCHAHCPAGGSGAVFYLVLAVVLGSVVYAARVLIGDVLEVTFAVMSAATAASAAVLVRVLRANRCGLWTPAPVRQAQRVQAIPAAPRLAIEAPKGGTRLVAESCEPHTVRNQVR